MSLSSALFNVQQQSSNHGFSGASFLLTKDGRRAGQLSKPQPPPAPAVHWERKTERERERNRRARGREGSGWKQSMDAVRIEGTARSSLTRKRKISKLSRRIETRRQVSLCSSHFALDISSLCYSLCQYQFHQHERETSSVGSRREYVVYSSGWRLRACSSSDMHGSIWPDDVICVGVYMHVCMYEDASTLPS